MSLEEDFAIREIASLNRRVTALEARLGAQAFGTESQAPERGSDTPFDPAEHSVRGVKAYLAAVDPAEKARVLAAERAGQNRSSITGEAP